MTTNPFNVQCYNGHQCIEQTSSGRISMVKSFDASQCADALVVPGLQKTVAHAVEVRMRKLAKAAA